MKIPARRASHFSNFGPITAALFLFSAALLPSSGLRAQPPALEQPVLRAGSRPVFGAAALSAMGNRLVDVARANRVDPSVLAGLLRQQSDLGVDARGALLFACRALVVGAVPAGALPVNSSTYQLAVGGAVDPFVLHSLPGANRVIFLDFTGHVTAGTAWNSSYTAGADIVSQAFDLDGDPTTYSDGERAMITAIWKRVAEDFAPLAIDVTTQDPGIEALRKTASSDSAFGIRVVVSPTNWYNTNAGGTAYVGSFDWNSDTPCFVFTQQLANGEKYIAEAISHEAGHTLGLFHDGAGGASPTEYYQGQGDWAPIMGVGYYKTITQFSKGEYANANNLQDDFSVMATRAPLVADDHGNTLATATVLSAPDIATGGTIERGTDVDVFRFDSGAGPLSLDVLSPSPDSNLSAKVELLTAGGSALASATMPEISATFDLSVPAGTYYLRISGVGFGDPLSTGYSTYGSVGNYVILGTFTPVGGLQAPKAALTVSTITGASPLIVSFSGVTSTDADGTIVSYVWNFGNGTTATGPTASCTYASVGSYLATLTVTDNDGLSSSANVTIQVDRSPAGDVDVASYNLGKSTTPAGTAAVAVVQLATRLGLPAAGATVTIQWSGGLVSGTTTGKTDASGKVSLASGRTKKRGTITGTISLVTPVAPDLFDPAIYAVPTALSVTN